jgi:hypothetical protein
MNSICRRIDIEFFSQSHGVVMVVESWVDNVQEGCSEVEFVDVLRSLCKSEEKFKVTISIFLNIVGWIQDSLELGVSFSTLESES